MNATLDLSLPSGPAASLLRAIGAKPARPTAITRAWHDTGDHALADDGLTLVEHGPTGRRASSAWRLERLWPEADAIAPSGTPEALLAAATTPADLPIAPQHAAALRALCRFTGRLRSTVCGDVRILLLDGDLHTSAATRPVQRITLAGPDAAVATLADDLAVRHGAALPPASLAAEALALAGHTLPPRRLGVPALPPGLAVGPAFAFVCAHLTDVVLHFAPLATNVTGSEPVHQMRVALRRLRSAIRLFRRAIACPALTDATAELRALGHALGPAREWDVFLAGAGPEAAAAIPATPAMRRLLAAARRQRAAVYAALRAHLRGPEFRRLTITLALCARTQPWPPTPLAAAGLRDHTDGLLAKRWRRLLKSGTDITTLPIPQLHDLRLQAKRLRYAAEIVAPLHGRHEASQFIGRLSALQECLGHLNDAATAARLMAELGPAGRGFAGGAVTGYVTAQASGARTEIAVRWHKLRKTKPFWG